MRQYLDLLQHIIDNGVDKQDRTGIGTRSIFGYQMRMNLADGFPLLTTKKLPFKTIATELLWFLRADTNIRYLIQNNVHIWTDWNFDKYLYYLETNNLLENPIKRYSEQWYLAKEGFTQRIKNEPDFATKFGDAGPIYGKQWCKWETKDGEEINQLKEVINLIKKDPNSRRLLVSAWNVADIDKMVLSPCHVLYQFMVINGKLSCQLYQRSADVFLGVPFNIASYALLTMMVAHVCNLEVGEFIHTFGDVHIYNNLMDQCKEQLTREPKPLPKLFFKRKVDSIFDFTIDDFELTNYNPAPLIKGTVAV